MFLSLMALADETNILFDFEGGVTGWNPFGSSIFPTGIKSTEDAYAGTNAMSVDQFVSFLQTNQFGGVNNFSLQTRALHDRGVAM